MENGVEKGPRGRRIDPKTMNKMARELDIGPDDHFDRWFGWMFFWVDWFRSEE